MKKSELVFLSSIALMIVVNISTIAKMRDQTLTVAIPPNTPYSVAFEHNGEATGFRMWCDGTIVKNYTATEINAGRSAAKSADGYYTYTLSAPGMAAGMHSCLMSALYDGVEEKGDIIQVPIGNLPMKPIGFRINVVIK